MCGKIKLHSDSPILKYCQNALERCCFNSLASDFDSIKQTKSANNISFYIEELLKNKAGNRIDFVNAILKNQKKLKGEPRVYYSLGRYKRMGSFHILTDITEHLSLVQLMDSSGNVNHAISIVEYYIFD